MLSMWEVLFEACLCDIHHHVFAEGQQAVEAVSPTE